MSRRWVRRRARPVSTMLALLTAGTAVATGAAAVVAVEDDAPGRALSDPVWVQVEPDLPYGITQQSVEAALAEEPAAAPRPLTLHVTGTRLDDHRSVPEHLPEADLYLSVHPYSQVRDPAELEKDASWLRGVAVSEELSEQTDTGAFVPRQMSWAYRELAQHGQGPDAVAQAARAAGRALYGGQPAGSPTRWAAPAAWLALTGALAVAWFRVHRREDEAARVLLDAEARLTRGLLELETAEQVSALGAAGGASSLQLARSAERLGRTASALAERHAELLAASPLRTPWRPQAPLRAFRDDVRAFARQVDRFAEQADGAVGVGRVAEPVSSPLTTAQVGRPPEHVDAADPAQGAAGTADLRGRLTASGLLWRDGDGGARGPRLSWRGWAAVFLAANLLAYPAGLAARAWWNAAPEPEERAQVLPAAAGVEEVTLDVALPEGSPPVELDREGLRREFSHAFPEAVEVTVAVRPGAGRLTGVDGGPGAVHAEPEMEGWGSTGLADAEGLVLGGTVLDADAALRGEFPELTDPTTGQMRPGQVLVPVYVVDPDPDLTPPVGSAAEAPEPTYAVAPAQFTAPVAVGHDQQQWVALRMDVDEDLTSQVSRRLSEAAAAQTREELPPVNARRGGLSDAAWGVGLLYLLLLAATMEAAVSLSWGLRGPGALTAQGRRLARLRRRLEALLLQEDVTLLDALVLRDRRADAVHGLYERELTLAWRVGEALAQLPLGARARGAAEARLDWLEEAVTALEGHVARLRRRAAQTPGR